MFDLKCEVCNSDQMQLDNITQLENIPFDEISGYKEVERYVDNELSQLMVFRCMLCNNVVNYTIKDLLDIRRRQVKDYILEQLVAYRSFSFHADATAAYVLIYCGRCHGQDGKGSCRVDFYNQCDIKEIPVG